MGVEAHDTVELEQRILGAVLASPGALDRLNDALGEGDFAHDAHRDIWRAIVELYQAGRTPTPLTVAPCLGNEDIAGLEPRVYLLRLAASAPMLIALEDEARTLVELSRRRRLFAIAEGIAHDARHGVGPVEDAVERAETALHALRERRAGDTTRTMRQAADEALRAAAAAYDRGEGLSGLPTGIRDLDRLMGGLQSTDLVIVAGRPGMGKTSLATNITCNLADAGTPVGFFSLEMSGEQLATRVIAERAGVPSSRIRRGAISESEYADLERAGRAIADYPVIIDQAGGISIAQLAIRARRMKRQHGIGAIVVDYIQLMAGSGKRRDANRVAEVTEITTGLKALAKDLGVPVIALSQLSREVEKRDDKRPRLSDLRESGSIEQDADVVLFVYREAYYLAAAKPAEGAPEFFEWEAKLEAIEGRAEIIVAKQRHGPTGTVDVAFDAAVTAFRDLPAEAA